MPKISLKSKIFSKKSFILILITTFLIICLLVANFLSAFLIKTESKTENVSSNSFDIYILTLAKSQVEKEAESLASDYQQIGAGGYIWKNDDYFYVVSSAYINKNDAVLVQNSVKVNQGLDSEIITVNFKSSTINGNFTSEEKKVLTKALNSFCDYYLKIYDIAISLDTAVYNEISARLAINSAHNNLNNIIDDYNTLFKDVDDDGLKSLGNCLNKALNASKFLCGGTPISKDQTYSSILKYRYLEVLSLYYDFINGI